MFGVLPHQLLKLPLSEFATLRRYYVRVREQAENASSVASSDPTDGFIQE